MKPICYTRCCTKSAGLGVCFQLFHNASHAPFCPLLLKVLYLSPPLEHARAAWIHQFHAYLHTAAGLPRLRSKSFAVLGVSVGCQKRSAVRVERLYCISDTRTSHENGDPRFFNTVCRLQCISWWRNVTFSARRTSCCRITYRWM